MQKQLRNVWIASLLLLPLSITVYAQSLEKKYSHPWFTVKKINEKVWRIGDGDIDNIYLIEGRDSALVIDNGIGAYNLRDFIKSITGLPLILVNTHSHPDHTGSIHQFSKVHAHPDDFEMIRFFNTKEMRTRGMKNMMRIPVPDSLKFPITDSTYIAALSPVKDGYVFNLGDRKIEVVHVPGHTKGSICLLDHKDKILYTGDNDNTLVWLHTQDALPLEVYLQSLQKLQNREKEFTTLLPAHGDPIDKEFIKEQIMCVKEIIAGNCVGKPYETFVGNGLLCRHKRAQVAYDPAKIKVKP
jgi:hydroxyacylglutathione hydrolase